MAQRNEAVRPLNISIVGAGMAGLTAAIALRQNGHHVEIFESSEIKKELGAGIGVQINAMNILEQFGLSRDNLKGIDFDGVIMFDAKGGESTTFPWLVPRKDGKHDVYCHRSDLHDELTRLAVGDGPGPPAKLHLGSEVVECDPQQATLTLQDGRVIHGDLVLGADGIKSVIRRDILGYTQKATGLGMSCFRGLFDAAKVHGIPDLAWLSEGISGARAVALREEQFRMMFIYPCRNGTVINFVGFHPDPHHDDPDWTSTTSREELLEQYKDFHPKFLRIFELEDDSEPIIKWQLRALPLLPTWIRGRAAILGDAAHATLPLMGPGVAMAVEEAASLGCLLPLGTTREDVPARLEAYQALRKPRGEYVNTESVEQASVPSKRGRYMRTQEMQNYIFEYDAVKVAQDSLRSLGAEAQALPRCAEICRFISVFQAPFDPVHGQGRSVRH
ncbi:FAD/NAD(P)-binding domain-containing protein [Mycena rebaudengoi]|nr:FAD/NAD(P)-binding domain-containing protein [Mycena rebaudengoi]